MFIINQKEFEEKPLIKSVICQLFSFNFRGSPKMTTTFAVLIFMSFINQLMTSNSTENYTAPLAGK